MELSAFFLIILAKLVWSTLRLVIHYIVHTELYVFFFFLYIVIFYLQVIIMVFQYAAMDFFFFSFCVCDEEVAVYMVAVLMSFNMLYIW